MTRLRRWGRKPVDEDLIGQAAELVEAIHEATAELRQVINRIDAETARMMPTERTPPRDCT